MPPCHCELRVAGYRSIRDLTLPLGPVNVLTGPNGCGKSNLYRAMFLLARAAEGGFGPAIAGEGGMPSVLWAGREKVRLTRRAKPRRVVISFAMDDYGYELQFGLPASGTPSIEPSMFLLDREVKAESVWIDGPRGRRVALMERDHSAVSMRDAEGRMAPYPLGLYKSGSRRSPRFASRTCIRNSLRYRLRCGNGVSTTSSVQTRTRRYVSRKSA